MQRGRIVGKVAKIVLIVVVVFTLLTFIVMNLWNCVLTAAVQSVNPITFWQAAGLLILSKILFGGFSRGGGWKDKRDMKRKLREKWQTMSPEERERFKAQMKDRCGRWGRRDDFFEEEKKSDEQVG